MKGKGKYIWWVLVTIIVAVFFYAYREYTRRPADLFTVHSQASIRADSLTALYERDESNANGLYLGKPIDVTGRIDEIGNQKDTAVNVLLGSKGGMHRVSCLMSRAQLKRMKQYKVGDEITVRGICTGYLLDVELNRCVIIK